MEERGGNPLYGNWGNINYPHTNWLHHPPSLHHHPFCSIDKFLFSQCNNYFYQQQQQQQNSYDQQDRELSLFPSSVFSCTSNANGLLHHVDQDLNTCANQTINQDIVNLDSQSVRPSKSTRVNHGGSSSSTLWVKGQWSSDEDRKLLDLVDKYGLRKWSAIATHMTGRIGKQCRERWQNHLRPNIKKDQWTEEEERLLIETHEKVGNRWAEIAKSIPGRSENSIKNHWNATKRKQTSKRKIRRPAALNGVKFSKVLEEYIKNKYFNNKGSSSNNFNSNDNFALEPDTPNNNNNNNNNNAYDDDDDDCDASISFLTSETYEEEMNFMTNLFGNRLNTVSHKDTQMTSFYAVEENMDISQQEDENFLLPSEVFSSSMLEESLGSTVSDFAINEETQVK